MQKALDPKHASRMTQIRRTSVDRPNSRGRVVQTLLDQYADV